MVSNQSTFSSIKVDTVSLTERKFDIQAEISIDDHTVVMSSKEMQEVSPKDRIPVKSELETAKRLGGGRLGIGPPHDESE